MITITKNCITNYKFHNIIDNSLKVLNGDRSERFIILIFP
jgi:hypothetical protein